MEKRCPRCEKTLPHSSFARNVNKKDKLQGECKPCQSARRRAAYAADPEKGRERSQKWRKENPEKYLEARRKAQKTRPDWYLMDRYHMTIQDYERILESQGGLCGNRGCENSPPAERRFHVDHDHACCPGFRSCGQCIRGLLCANCNQALGNALDNVARLAGLVEYLQRDRKPYALRKPKSSQERGR